MQNPMRNNTRLGGHLSEREVDYKMDGGWWPEVAGFITGIAAWAVIKLMA